MNPVSRRFASFLVAVSILVPGAATVAADPARAVEPSPGLQQATGVLRVGYADDFKGRSVEVYWLETATGTVPFELQPGEKAPAPGTIVRISGTPGTTGVMRAADVQAATAPEALPVAEYAPPTAPTRSILVIIGDFTDMAGHAVTNAEATGTFTGSGSTVQAFFAAASRGTVATTSTVVGPWPLGIAATCDNGAVWTAGDAVARAHGINPAAYDHVVVWTRQPACAWWAGMGGGDRVWITQDYPSASWNGQANMATIANHELGHDLGLAHAMALWCEDPAGHQLVLGGTCQDDPYVDPFSTMGNGYAFYALFDAEELRQLGWLQSGEVRTVSAVGTYVVVSPYSGTAGARVLRIPRGPIVPFVDVGAWTMEARSQLTGAFDQFDPAYTTVTGGATIRFTEELWPAEVGFGGPTFLLDMTPTGTTSTPGEIGDAPLLAGETWADVAGGLTFRVDSVGTVGAVVTIGDTAPPSAPGSLTATAGAGSARLDWGAASDNLGLAGYALRRDGALVASLPVATRTFTDTAVTPGATLTYAVTALDTAGLEGPAAAATVTIPTAPGPPLNVVAVPGDGSAAVAWSAPASNGGSPITGYTVTAAPDGAQCVTTGALACSVGGLANGTEYQFSVTASNAVGTGAASAPSAGVTPERPPSPWIAPLPAWTLGLTIPVAWGPSPGSAAVASYDVQYRRAAWSGVFGAYVLWQSASTATGAALPVTRGSTICFSVRAHGVNGATSPWTANTCTVVPLDDRSLVRSGPWIAGTNAAYYGGTYALSSTYGARLTRTGVLARQIAIVATTCSTCGSVRVYWGSTLLRTISLYSRTVVYRAVLNVTTFSSMRSGTVTIKVSSSGKRVIIDGLAIRRT